jgi:hypothetical protein
MSKHQSQSLKSGVERVLTFGHALAPVCLRDPARSFEAQIKALRSRLFGKIGSAVPRRRISRV